MLLATCPNPLLQTEPTTLPLVVPWKIGYGSQDLCIYRIEIHTESIDPLEWLKEQTIFPKIFWHFRDADKATAALGTIHSSSTFPTLSIKEKGSSNTTPRWFFSKEFDKNISHAILPLIEVHDLGDHAIYILQWITEEEKETALQILESQKSPKKTYSVNHWSILSRTDEPQFSVWKQKVQLALSAIAQKKINKVVLARKTTFTLKNDCSPLEILSLLQPKRSRTTLFAICYSEKSAFLGNSPELLYARKGNIIFSEAIAGTRPKGITLEEEKKWHEDLVNSKKEQCEFMYVKKRIESLLKKYCSNYHQINTGPVLVSTHLQHLYSAFYGQLKEHFSDQSLIKSFHPTPAVAGSPKQASLATLLELETFQREFYAAPIGWLSADTAEFVVGIRSSRFEGNLLHVYAGVGIVLGSDPDLEWQELESKIHPFVEILYGRV